jgi:hypothetical protein
MRKPFIPFAAAALMMGYSAGADPFVDAVVKNFQDMGYQFVEIYRGSTQLRAEGVRGTQELEVIYDLATGRVIRQETGPADASYIGRSGVEINSGNRDFVGRSGRDDFDDDDDDDDRSSSRSSRDDFDDDDDDDDRSSSGSSRDDNDDDNDDDDSSGSDSSGSDSSGSGSDDSDDDNDDDD